MKTFTIIYQFMNSFLNSFVSRKTIFNKGLILLIYFFANTVYSQIIFQEGFEYACGANCPAQPFFDGCALPWINTHGSPDLNFDNTHHNGNQSAHMFCNYFPECSDKRLGEGIALNFYFNANNTYKLSYYSKLTKNTFAPNVPLGIVSAKWILPSGNFIPVDGCDTRNSWCLLSNYYLPAIPPLSEVVSNANLSLDNWVYTENQFTPTKDFTQLWMRLIDNPNIGSENIEHSCRLYLDDIQIECVSGDCLCESNGCYSIWDQTGTKKVKDAKNNVLPDFNTGCYYVRGILDINQDFSMDHCVVKFSPGSKIIVRNGVTLSLDNANLKGCISMWKGIELEAGAHISWIDGSIEDAQYGINCLGNVSIDYGLDLNFKNCYVGIYSPPSSKKTINSYLTGNTFSFEVFKPFFTGQNPLPQNRTFAGIELNDAILFLDKGLNSFTNLQNGIVARRSDIEVVGCFFNQMIAQIPSVASCTKSLTTPDGYGIYFNTCRNKAIANNNYIFTTSASIVSYLGSLEAKDNIIYNTSYGIYCDKLASLLSVNIKDNQINGFNAFGIRISNPIKYNSINVIHNIISSSFTPLTISCTNSAINFTNVIAQKKAIIENNQITNIASVDGIRLEHCVNIGVHENTISFSNPYLIQNTQDGIEINTCRYIFVYHNTINGSGINTATGSAFEQLSSSQVTLCCNISDNIKYGFNFKGGNDPTLLKANNMYLHYNGVRIENGSEISRQYYLGNKWNVASQVSYHYNAVNLNVNQIAITNSQFRINSCTLPLWPTNVFPIQVCVTSNLDNWFYKVNNVNQTCPNISDCVPNDSLSFLPGGGIPIDDNFGYRGLELNRDEETAIRSDIGTVLEREAKHDLMLKLVAYPDQIGINSSIDSFYYSSLSENIFKLTNIEYQLSQTLKVSNSHQDSFDLQADTLNILLNDYNSLLYSLITATNILDTITILNQMRNVFNNLATHYLVQDEIVNSSLNQLTANLDSLNLLNQSLTPNNILQSNEKKINNFIINKLLRSVSEFSTGDLNTLFSIASQCPKVGGRSVYLARSIYNELESFNFSDDSTCLPNQAISTNLSNLNSKLEGNIFISPNPSAGLVKLSWNSSFVQIKEIKVLNSLNHIIKTLNQEFTKMSEQVNLDLTQLQNGIYFLLIEDIDGDFCIKKIIINN